MEDQCCNNCRFWDENHSGIGECRRRAPLPMLVANRPNGKAAEFGGCTVYFPQTLSEEWCGEWEMSHRPPASN